MLRTPSAIEGDGGAIREDVARAKNRMLQVRDQMAQLAAENGLKVSPSLMPTPNTMDHLPARTPEQKAANKGKGGYSNVRETVVNDLLPTPTAADGMQGNKNAPEVERAKGRTVHMTNMGPELVSSWGKFAPAIHRWETVTGRKAPAPTKPDGKDGNHRLSSEFTEWMMGLPAGWITGVGLSRNDELKACGNGVVPQQAELALRHLLENVAIPNGGGK